MNINEKEKLKNIRPITARVWEGLKMNKLNYPQIRLMIKIMTVFELFQNNLYQYIGDDRSSFRRLFYISH
jgi:hypothetical protein